MITLTKEQFVQLAAVNTTASAATPSFSGGIDYAGTGGRFTKFSAHATDVAYGDAGGYADLQSAIDAMRNETIGAKLTAAGVFEHDGRFYGRVLDNKLTFATGATWEGAWRLEQYPQDRELFDGSTKGTTRSEALRAIVDGAQLIDVSTVPVA